VIISLISQTAPSGESDPIGLIMNVLWIGLIVFSMFYGQKIQTWMMLREISGALDRLTFLKNEARKVSIHTIKEIKKKDDQDPSPRIDHFLEYFTILPVDLDPTGIVPKIDHILNLREKRFEDEIRTMVPEANEIEINNLEGVLETSVDLNEIFKIVRHFYLLGRKTMSLYVIMQVQMQLPLIMQIAEAYFAFCKAFADGQPVGDGAGPLVVGKMMLGLEKKEVIKDTVSSETNIDGREVILVKAEGPGCSVGKPGEAIQKIIEEKKGKVSSIIMIDAAQKLEGEETGSTAEGVGPVIGGIGVEKYKIEEVATKYKVPLEAVVIKQLLNEAISPMLEEIYDGVDIASARVKRLIQERTKEGDTVIIAGIGNSVGIGQ